MVARTHPHGGPARALLACALSAVVALGAAAPTQAATVVVSDSALTPARVTIPPLFSVTWTNTGTQAHAIAPDDRDDFDRFTLAPGGQRTIAFRQAGRHPYEVDGARPGLVIVRAARAAPRDRRGRRDPTDGRGTCDTRRTYRYDITVRGRKTSTDTVEDGGTLRT